MSIKILQGWCLVGCSSPLNSSDHWGEKLGGRWSELWFCQGGASTRISLVNLLIRDHDIAVLIDLLVHVSG